MKPVQAPILKGQKLGQIVISGPNDQIRKLDLVASKNIDKVGYFGKLKAIIGSWFK